MKDIKTYIGWLMGGMLMLLLLLTGCKSSAEEEIDVPEKPVLKIYVFAPDRPIVTRADNGNVNATEAENAINNLHVWVFEHADGNPVGHISADGSVISTGQAILTMEVSDDFAERQPNVDVYVMANVTNDNCGLSLGEGATRAQLDAALIPSDKFGVTSLVTTVPDGGLPMSGVLKDQEIFGSAPVFGVGSKTTKVLSNVKLVRAVSKVQFVFTAIDKIDDDHYHTVKSISLDADMIPTTENLFLDGPYSAEGGAGYRYKVGDTYESAATLMNTSTDINPCDPARGADYYVYKTQTGQVYEDLIADGLKVREGHTTADLTSCGTYYLRESDKQITGTITYDKDEITNNPKTATFKLSEAGFVPGDFGRNHTWIVYGYFTEKLGLLKVNIKVKEWETLTPLEHTIYNW